MPRTPKNIAAEDLAVAILRFIAPEEELRQDIDSSMVAAEVAQALEAYLDLWLAAEFSSQIPVHNTGSERFWTPGDTEMPNYTVAQFRYHARAYFSGGLLLGAALMACIWWLA